DRSRAAEKRGYRVRALLVDPARVLRLVRAPSMSTASLPAAEVFSVREIARAAGVPTSVARRVIGSAREYLGPADAVRFVRMLRGAPGRPAEREIFAPPLPAHRSPAPALAASGGLHVAALGLALFVFGL